MNRFIKLGSRLVRTAWTREPPALRRAIGTGFGRRTPGTVKSLPAEAVAGARMAVVAAAIAWVLAAVPAPPPAAAQLAVIRVNAGGPAYTDALGQVWDADTGYSGGQTADTQSAIDGTADAAIYQSVRYGNFGYNFHVPNGAYFVTLKFAEIYWDAPHSRVFSVFVEGYPVLSDLDIWAQVGPNRAFDYTTVAVVTDGVLNIRFRSRVDNAALAALEILPVGAPAHPTVDHGHGVPPMGTEIASAGAPPQASGAISNGLASLAPPSRSIQSMVDEAPAGGTVSVPPGIYREEVTISKPISLVAEPGAEIRGSDVWTDWIPARGRWMSQRSVPVFPPVGSDRCDGGRCAWPEQVFLDGQPLIQVPSNPASGQFAVDGGRHVIIADNPLGHLVEVTIRTRWITGQADNVTIQGFTMRHAASGALDGGLSVGANSNGWTIQDNVLLHAHGSVLWGGYGSGHRILRNEIGYGGAFGIIDTGHGALVQGNDIHNNNTEAFNCGWGCGGLKTTQTGVTIDNNEVHDNDGPGLWFDIHADNATITNNRIHHNRDMGILFEISSGGLIADNVAWKNGEPSSGWGWGGGIVLSTSANVEVTRNVVAWNADGITVLSQARDDAPAAGVVGNYVHDNVIIHRDLDPSSYALGWLSDNTGPMYQPGANNRGENNVFWVGSGEGPFRFDWDGSLTRLNEFASTPGGQNSRYISADEKDQVLRARGVPTSP